MAIEICSSSKREAKDGGGVVYEFHIDSADDVKNLPAPGTWAATCSTALDIETYDVYFLRATGWKKGGEKQ